MKVEKKNNKYYVNDLDLEEVMANRKYVLGYIEKQIEFLRRTKEFNSFLTHIYTFKPLLHSSY